jgi:4-hydroxythreonine-4-phosphate dehydrogenase
LPVVGITLGDPSGIGPEVVAKALARRNVQKALVPVLFGDAGLAEAMGPFAKAARMEAALQKRPSQPTVCAVSKLPLSQRRPGKPSLAGGRAQFEYLEAAIEAAKRGFVDALCTAPVSKEQISRAHLPFMGHTEVLAEAFGCDTLMLMDGPRLKIALATNHLPLSQVSRALSTPKLTAQILLLSASLAPLLGRKPRIAVCSLNPHAGEGGLLGREEITVIGPAVKQAKARGARCSGPWAADGLFAQAGAFPFDVALAMYHDQGLVVAKALDFHRTVNVTLGLPLPRTSPDHGVAYALAGKNEASALPMESALLRAAEMARLV